jgi:hypothetical protein
MHCLAEDIETIKANKQAFITNLMALNIGYGVCMCMSGYMYRAIEEIEAKNTCMDTYQGGTYA